MLEVAENFVKSTPCDEISSLNSGRKYMAFSELKPGNENNSLHRGFR